MKEKHFIVIFENGKTVFVSAMNKEDAEILASAVMIKNGFTRNIKESYETNSKYDMVETDFIA